MKIAHTLTIVSSTLILAAGCTSSEQRNARSNDAGFSSTYGGTTSYETSAPTTSSQNPAQTGSQSYAPGASQTSAAASTQGTATQSETDRQLATQVQQQLRNDPTLATVAPNIQITAQNGTITLIGKVPSDREKEQIETTIRSIGGVVSVKNQLQVSLQPTSERSGQSSRIYTEPSSQQAGLTTDQSGQAATTPPVPAQNSTEIQASTQTDSKNEVSVATSETTQPAGQISDPSSTQVQDSRHKEALSPTSDKDNDTSRIYSKAESANASHSSIQASTDADRTLGRQIVRDKRADAAVAALVPMIKIKVDNGQVTLRGTVKSEQEKQQLETAVQKVAGVTKVDNQLQVGTTGQSDTSDTSTDTTKNPDRTKNP